MGRRRRSSKRASLVLAAGAGIAMSLLSAGGVLVPMDIAVFDQLVTRIHRTGQTSDVVVVGIDEPSFAELGRPWPWPREVHARLIDSLRAAGARIIAFDIVFAEPTTAEADRRFAEALGPDVVLASDLSELETPQGWLSMQVSPLPMFLDSGARTGLVSLPLDADGGVRRLPALTGSLAGALAGELTAIPEGALIDMSLPPAVQARVSYYQALDAAQMLPAGTFRDKVVLVGLTLRASPLTTPDKFRTPWTARGAGLMPGVELQARLVDTLSNRSWIVPVHLWSVALCTMLGALLGMVATRGRAGAFGTAASLGLFFGIVTASGGILVAGYWLPPAAPALASLVAGLGQAGLDHARERAARRAIIRSFEHYVAPEVVRQLVKDPDALRLGGERRHVTIMFCDLRGFTTLSERMRDRPEELTALINRALTIIGDAILETGGTIDKFIGDCAMGIWNAPVALADHPHRAVEAAIKAVEAIRAFADALREEAAASGREAPLVACGVGINSGWCTIGNMGSSKRFDYTAIGDPVNLAARLEGLTKMYCTPIVIGEDTAKMLPAIPLVELDVTWVKGRETPVRLYTPAVVWPLRGEKLQLQQRALAATLRGDPQSIGLWRDVSAAEPALRPYVDIMLDRARSAGAGEASGVA